MLLVVHLGEFLLHGGIPVILDRVVSASLEVLGDLCPAVTESLMSEEQQPLLLITPLLLLDVGIQMIVPTLSTLLADTP